MAESDWDILAPTSDISEDQGYVIIDHQDIIDVEEGKQRPKHKKQSTSHMAEWFTNIRFNYMSGSKPKINTKRNYIVMLGMWYTGYGWDSKFNEARTIRRFNIQQEFETDFQRLVWVTYRSGLHTLGHVSDTTWGCVIRSAQMMICNTMKFFVNRGYDALRLVKDNTNESPFGIQKILEYSKILYPEQPPERRYTPSSMWYILSQMPFEDLRIMYVNEPLVQEQELLKVAGDWDKPVLILVPLMLGMKSLSKSYYTSVTSFFNLRQWVGFIGGKPNSAYYFVGYQEEKLLYLDPHFAQKVSMDKKTYSCSTPRLIGLKDLESSLAVGFLLKSYDDYEDLAMWVDKSVVSFWDTHLRHSNTFDLRDEFDLDEFEII